uniref:Disks large-associated protein 3-like n=1 Tax=Sinocyclocheilus rhinocerous TaxID=307959 RepID=A0A673H2H3_9TELE
MKGYQVSRSLSQHSSGPCYCMPEDCDTARDYMHHPDHYQGHNDHPYYPPGGPPEPLAMVPSGGGTFPRSHPSQPQPYDSTCEECLSSAGHGHGHGAKMHRIPPNLLDQFEKQLPFHPDGFHTLQYQRTASGEQRSESPSRIRHLVNSVQRLFAKSHSLEAPSKREFNGTRGGEYRDRDRGHHSHHESRSSRHRSKTAGWWSSDDNLDSDSSFLVGAGRGGRGYPTGHETLDAAIQELTLRKSKGPPPGECLACTNIAKAGDSGHSLKRSTWSAMTVSQAREVYPSSRGEGGGGGYEKALVPLDPKMKERSLHYLQVPSDDWCGGGPSDSGGEIPCRRMRSGSYIKAMGDDDSADSDTSPKASPKSALIAQREAFRRSVSMDQRSSTASKSAVTWFSLSDTLNLFGQMESQAVEALDLPGCFRTRSHSYVRAIQAGCSQDDDCLSVFSMSGPQGCVKGEAVFPYRKGPPPLPPRMSKPMISVTAQSSTESTQDAYFQSTGQPALVRPRQHSNSVDLTESSGGRSSRGGHYLETLSDSDPEGKALREVHSIGVQVEDDKRRARFKRSNSVTASVQADLETEGFGGLTVPTQDKGLQFGCSFQRHSSEPESAGQFAEYRTVHTQGQWAYREDYHSGYTNEPGPPELRALHRSHSPLPLAPERGVGGWSEGPRSLPDSGRASPCLRDGEFFLRLLQTEVERMEGWCQNMEREAETNELPEESDTQDLASYWDLLQLAIEDIRVKFQDLQRLKDSGWRLPPEKKEDKKVPPPLPKKPVGGRSVPEREKSLDVSDRQKLDTRRRLLQTKRSASFRQNSATESADSIEIYITEAQTRL